MLRTPAPLSSALGVRYKRGVWNSFAINSELLVRRLKKLMCFAIWIIGAERERQEAGFETWFLTLCAHCSRTLKLVEEKKRKEKKREKARWLIESLAASARLTSKA